MRIYSQIPARRTRQVVADLLALAVIAVSVWFALLIHDVIMRLAAPGQAAQSAGDQLAGGLNDAGNAAARVPLVGDTLKRPLLSAAGAGNGLASAGESVQHTVSHLAFLVAFVLIAVPVLLVLLVWLPPRIHWIRGTVNARRLLDAPGGADLFALRALTGPLRNLATVEIPPGGLADAWRRGDASVIDDLSRIGLKQVGLRP
ncbi:hypothetical protein ABUW04_10290 [Streptacidiphilus sp. N1-10]|uniref:Uncharacterized protein n=1 Tax=Streptacidiphilus jeojiensis TaxID=3229225 RepID=A0ABV6XK71_9ACTN